MFVHLSDMTSKGLEWIYTLFFIEMGLSSIYFIFTSSVFINFVL